MRLSGMESDSARELRELRLRCMVPSNLVLLVGILVLVVCLLFPPWTNTMQSTGISQVQRPAGYAPLWLPPEPYWERFGKGHPHTGIVLAWPRLILQMGVVVLTTACLWWALQISPIRQKGQVAA